MGLINNWIFLKKLQYQIMTTSGALKSINK
jgi:hypothetical protein